jgi:glucan phosphoethanolaminetransferase (alkaline phosphatase superfamily)
MKHLFITISFFILMSFYGLLPAYVILDIAKMYHIPFLEELHVSQMFALYLIFRIVATKQKAEDYKNDLDLAIHDGLTSIFKSGLLTGIAWCMARLILDVVFR